MTAITPSEAVVVARDAVAQASRLLDGAQEKIGTIRTKSTSRDRVTEWDVRAEKVIRKVLHAATPDIAVLGEEAGESGQTGAGEAARLRWLIDPIDGTVNFSHGLPLFGVSVSLERDGAPIAGVVAAPAMGWEFWAHQGGGAFMNGRRLQVSGVSSLSEAMLATGFPYDRAQTRGNFRQWEHFQCTAGACRRMGAASLDLAMVARGWFDGYWETGLHPWDLSAGALLVAEAGGTVTDVTGGAFESRTGAAVASNGAIHDQILKELAIVAETDRGADHA